MADHAEHTIGRNPSDMPSRIEALGVQPLLQSLRATLANIDREYEQERERFVGRTKDKNLKTRLLEKLKRQRQ